ncbi:hypothetical protein [Peptoanaerobacter stomatis]
MKVDLNNDELLLVMNMVYIGAHIFQDVSPIVSDKLNEIRKRFDLSGKILTISDMEELIKE